MSLPRGEMIEWRDCQGRPDYSLVTIYTSPLVWLACPQMALEVGNDAAAATMVLLGPALGCAFIWRERHQATVILLPGELLLEHELDHIRGSEHPTLLPWLSSRCGEG